MIRSITGIGEGKGPYISIHDGFIGISKWEGFLPNSDRIILGESLRSLRSQFLVYGPWNPFFCSWVLASWVLTFRCFRFGSGEFFSQWRESPFRFFSLLFLLSFPSLVVMLQKFGVFFYKSTETKAQHRGRGRKWVRDGVNEWGEWVNWFPHDFLRVQSFWGFPMSLCNTLQPCNFDV